jgi:hypothetical protein
MRKSQIFILIAIFVCAFLSSFVLFSEEEAMRKVALKTMNEWKKTFSKEQVTKLGFDDMADFKVAELGIPFSLYTVDPAEIMKYTGESEFGNLVKDTNYMVYPIKAGGVNKALLWMYKKEDKWKIARIGSSKLAKTMVTTEGAIQSQTRERGLEGAGPPKFVRVYSLFLDFFFVKSAEREYIIPVYSMPNLRVEGSKFYTPKDIVPQWKEQLEIIMKTGEKKIKR